MNYKELKAKGICTKCKKQPAELDYVCCPTCIEKSRESGKRQIAKRRAEHRCLCCGRPALARRNYCQTCIDRDNHKYKKKKHIRVWEKAHGKTLPQGWIIHHLNGNHNDNHSQNLLAIPRRSHKTTLLFAALRKRIKQLETELKENNKQASLPLDGTPL